MARLDAYAAGSRSSKAVSGTPPSLLWRPQSRWSGSRGSKCGRNSSSSTSCPATRPEKVLKHVLRAEGGTAERSARPAERQYYEAGRAADAEADDSSRKTPTEAVHRFPRGAVLHADHRVRVAVALHLRRVEHVHKRLGVDFPAAVALRGERMRGVDLAGPEDDSAAIIASRAEACPVERDDARLLQGGD